MWCGIHNSNMTEVARRTTGGILVVVYKCDKNKHYIAEKQKQEGGMLRITPEQTARIHELAKAMDKSINETCQLVIICGLQILEGESNAYKNETMQLSISRDTDFQAVRATND